MLEIHVADPDKSRMSFDDKLMLGTCVWHSCFWCLSLTSVAKCLLLYTFGAIFTILSIGNV